MNRLEQLRARLQAIHGEEQTVLARVDQENRELSADETATLEALNVEFGKVEREIQLREAEEARSQRMASSGGRRTGDAGSPTTVRAGVETALELRSGADIRVVADREAESPRGGFRHFGEFAKAVMNAGLPNAVADRRLLVLNAATSYGSEGVGSDGGFAVPPEFLAQIRKIMTEQPSLYSYCNKMTTESNQLTFPTDETTAWQSSGGVQANWEGEAQQFSQSKLALKQVTYRLSKLTALVPVTDELLEDASAINSYVPAKIAEKLNFKRDYAIVNGNGVGMPLGMLNAPALITVAKESGQLASTVLVANISKMYNALFADWRPSAIWIANQDVEPVLDTLAFAPANTGGTGLIGGFPLYLQVGGIGDAPTPRLKGRPVVYHQAMPSLSSAGDLCLVDFRQYLMAEKASGVRFDTSIHLFFDYGLTAFRAQTRMAGNPWISKTIAALNGSGVYSAFVALGAR